MRKLVRSDFMSDLCSNCGAKAGQWCTWASTLEDTQLGGKQVPADAGDEIKMHCE
jgi:hypothetical protein